MFSKGMRLSVKRFGQYFYRDYIVWPLRQALGARIYPSQLNFSVTGFCNSQCVMCNVWMFPDQRPTELTPDELRVSLSDPLFKEVRHLGIAGGEPFLRKDIVEMAHSALGALPKLQTLTISTHGYHTRRMQQLTPAIYEACQQRQVRFRFSVSLDRVGSVHDHVRGIPGAFDKTMKTIRWIRDYTEIDLVIGATLSPTNIDDAFNLWHFCVRENISTNFRIATVVERLGNRDLANHMSLIGRDRYALVEFFENLAHSKINPLERRFFYLSSRRYLTENVARFAECRFKEEAPFSTNTGTCIIARFTGSPLAMCVNNPAM